MLLRSIATALILNLLSFQSIAHAQIVDPSAPASPSSSAGSGSLGPVQNSSGGSSADVGSLQPAGTNVLQSATDSLLGLGGPAASNSLQGAPASAETLKVIAADADGEPQNTQEDSNINWSWIISSAVITLLLGVIVISYRMSQKQKS